MIAILARMGSELGPIGQDLTRTHAGRMRTGLTSKGVVVFGKRKAAAAAAHALAREEAREAFHNRVAEIRRGTPTVYADGRPTGFPDQIDAMRAVADGAFDRDDGALIQFCFGIICVLVKPNCEPQDVNAFIGKSVEVGRTLRQIGLINESNALAKASAALTRYWDETGLLERAANIR